MGVGGERHGDASNLFLAVLQHVLVLGEFFLLLAFDAFGLVSEPAGVLLLQPLNRLLLLPLQVLHLLVVLSLLTLEDRRERVTSDGESKRDHIVLSKPFSISGNIISISLKKTKNYHVQHFQQ